jgi:hypothetical protein
MARPKNPLLFDRRSLILPLAPDLDAKLSELARKNDMNKTALIRLILREYCFGTMVEKAA